MVSHTPMSSPPGHITQGGPCRRDTLIRVVSLFEEIDCPTRRSERLSEESSCIDIGGTRIACFCVELDEQFVGQSDPDDHFVFSCGEQSVAEICKGLVVGSGDLGDQEKD